MKHDPRGLFSRLISTRQFLFSRSSTQPEETTHRLGALPAADPLAQAFPEVLVGEAFVSAALEALGGWEAFAALALHIEPAESPAADGDGLALARLALARVLAPACRGAHGLWGVLDPCHMGCFLPGDAAAGQVETASRVQESFAGEGCGTLTAGVAFYPMIDFEREEILANAFKALDHAEFFGPGSRVVFDAVSLNISGDKRYDAGDIDGAVREYGKGLLLDPDNVNIHNSLGVCYGVMGDFERALGEFAAATRLDEGEVMAVYNTGLIHSLRKETERGLAFLKKAEALDGSLFEVVLQLGRVTLEAGDAETARQYLEKARTLNPQSGAVAFCLGECCSALKRPKEAISAYQAAIKSDPYHAAALSALGWLYHQREENREIALLFCEQSVKIAPETPLFRFRLGRLYLGHGRIPEALAAFQAAAMLGHDVASDLEEIRRLSDCRGPGE